jgi:hypothetical protein
MLQKRAPAAGTRRAVIAAALALAFLVALGVLGYRWARDDSLARLVEFSGQPERDTASLQDHWLPAAVGDRFVNGDGARTSARDQAYFQLKNGARVRLQPASRVRFLRAAKGGSQLQVDLGQVDVQSEAQAVRVDSEFGELRLDPNSAIHLRREADRLQVDVEVGRLELGAQGRTVAPGERVQLELGGIELEPTRATNTAPEPSPAKPAEPAASEPPPELKLGDGVAQADLVVHAGDSFVVHDPDAPLAIGFTLAGACAGPARLISEEQSTESAAQPSLRFAPGRHRYEVRCLDRPGVVAAQGTVSVVGDAGTRQLPSFAPTASVVTDGRSYTVMYQYRLPRVTLSWSSAPVAPAYLLEVDGRAIQTRTPSYEFPALGSGTHRITFSAATQPPRRSRTTTVDVVLDRQAPAARVASPPLGFDPAPSVNVAGQALPGWQVSVGGEPLPLDERRNFVKDVAGNAPIAIAFSHPSHGTHYYLRRPKGWQP